MRRTNIRNAGAVTLALVAFAFLLAGGSEARAGVMDPLAVEQLTFKTVGQWTQDWWNWALSEPVPNDPLSDTTGADANRNQSGPVFFLGGTIGGTANRTFQVPTNKYLLLPLVNIVGTEVDAPNPAALAASMTAIIDNVDTLSFSLDGVAVPESELFTHRAASGTFLLYAVAGNVADTPAGVPAGLHPFAFSDGYWLMLEPLGPGQHQISFGGGVTAWDFSVAVNDTVNPVPVPSAFGLLALGLAGIGYGLRSRR